MGGHEKAPSTGAKSLWAWVELNYRPHAYQLGPTTAAFPMRSWIEWPRKYIQALGPQLVGQGHTGPNCTALWGGFGGREKENGPASRSVRGPSRLVVRESHHDAALNRPLRRRSALGGTTWLSRRFLGCLPDAQKFGQRTSFLEHPKDKTRAVV
jgi:hypothetical protein